MPKTGYYAFRQSYPSLSYRLLTEAQVYNIPADPNQKGITVIALWDTGASGSVITPSLAQTMNLIPINRIKVAGINNTSMADVVKISIGLPNGVMIKEENVMICNLVKGVDLIIGMDIIQLGDFSISNGGGKTLFSFAIPPFDNKTDHLEKAIAINKRNKFY
jgi:predicted aspartyl protease